MPATTYSWNANSSYRDFVDRCSAIETDFADPLYGCQSEFHDRDSDAEDINVEPVWAEGNLGEGIIVRIVDKGVDYEHEDLRDNFDLARSYAAQEYGSIFEPDCYHGTAVAGIVAARDNSVGGRGVAPRATIYSYTTGCIGFGWSEHTKGATHELRDTAVSNHSAGMSSRQEYPAYNSSWLGTGNRKGNHTGIPRQGDLLRNRRRQRGYERQPVGGRQLLWRHHRLRDQI